MVVVDTNVVSELMRRDANVTVLRWFDVTPQGAAFLPVIAQAEIFAGIALMPEGRRRTVLESEAHDVFAFFAPELSCRSIAPLPRRMATL